MDTTSEDVGTFYQHYPRVAAIVTARSQDKINAMTVDWHTPLSFRPPLYGICVAPGRFTHHLIAESKEFGLNFLPFEAVELAHLIGSSAGGLRDKFQEFDIARDEPIKTSVPLLRDAYTAYECRLVDERGYGNYRLLVGEILAVHARRGAFTSEGILDISKVSPILYMGDEQYLSTAKDTLRNLEHKAN